MSLLELPASFFFPESIYCSLKMLFSRISAVVVTGLALVDSTVAQNKFPLTGVQTGIVNGVRPPRRDIRDVFNDKPAL